MVIGIGRNIVAFKAQRQLGLATDRLASSFERLASGSRINKAADDAAGLAIVSSLEADTRVFTRGLQNINDGLSLLSIAQGALLELSHITSRQQELAEQAANGVYSQTQREALHTEALALTKEQNRIIQSASFNGVKLLDGSASELRIQAGYSVDGGISFALGGELAKPVGTGTYLTPVSFGGTMGSFDVTAIDLNGDGKLDLLSSNDTLFAATVMLGNGDGTFSATTSFTTGSTSYGISTGDFNQDGFVDLAATTALGADLGTVQILLGNGDGTFKARTSFVGAPNHSSDISLGDVNGDSHLDLVAAYADGTSVSVLLGNGNGSFRAPSFSWVGIDSRGVNLADFNNDGKLDIVSLGNGTDSIGILLGNGDGTFKARASYAFGAVLFMQNVSTGDANGDGIADIVAFADDYSSDTTGVLIGNGDGTFKAYQTYAVGAKDLADLNGDDVLDMVGSQAVVLGNGDGSFKAPLSYASSPASPYSAAPGDFNGDGVPDLVIGDNTTSTAWIYTGIATESTRIQQISLRTRDSALSAIPTLSRTQERIGSELGAIGAMQSRLMTAARNIMTSREQYQTALSRIRDADVAAESAESVRNSIRQQTATAVLAQANQAPSVVLSLLS